MCTQEMVLNSFYLKHFFICECGTKDGTQDLLHARSNALSLNSIPSSLSAVFYLTSSICCYPRWLNKYMASRKTPHQPSVSVSSTWEKRLILPDGFHLWLTLLLLDLWLAVDHDGKCGGTKLLTLWPGIKRERQDWGDMKALSVKARGPQFNPPEAHGKAGQRLSHSCSPGTERQWLADPGSSLASQSI